MLKKSTVFNFLYIFQLIQKVLTSNFLNLVLNIHICLYKNSKILFQLEKNNFYVKISTFFFSQTPKSKAIFGIFVPSCPKSARNKVYQINLNFSKIQSAAMSVDVSLRSKKRITVQRLDFSKKSQKQFFDLTFTDVHMGRQKVPKSDFQSQFSMSKIIRIFLNFFSLKNISLGPHFL